MSADDLFAEHLTTIDAVVTFIIRRHRLSADEAEEFRSHVHEKLLVNEQAILRKFEGRSSLRTFLVTVVERLFLDHRTARWGKWRPSVTAKRLGPTAVRLETLTSRDGLSFDEAASRMLADGAVTETRAGLYGMFVLLPARVRRTTVGEEALETLPAPPVAGDPVESEERGRLLQVALHALGTGLEGLGPQERLVVMLRYEEGLTVATIARTLGLDQKRLYRALENARAALRRHLEAAGAEAAAVLDALDDPFALDSAHERGKTAPGSVTAERGGLS